MKKDQTEINFVNSFENPNKTKIRKYFEEKLRFPFEITSWKQLHVISAELESHPDDIMTEYENIMKSK